MERIGDVVHKSIVPRLVILSQSDNATDSKRFELGALEHFQTKQPVTLERCQAGSMGLAPLGQSDARSNRGTRKSCDGVKDGSHNVSKGGQACAGFAADFDGRLKKVVNPARADGAESSFRTALTRTSAVNGL